MSSTTLPISPARFAAALRDLPLSTLHLKAAELRNSIAHLDYSNEQLRPFAEGLEPAGAAGPDADCADAVRENEGVIERMEERIRLLRVEVEGRGCSWAEFQEVGKVEGVGEVEAEGEALVNGADGRADGERSEAWRDGTFQTGRIVDGEVRMDGVGAAANGTVTANGTNGVGGRLDDETLRRAVEERMRAIAEEGDEEGVHL